MIEIEENVLVFHFFLGESISYWRLFWFGQGSDLFRYWSISSLSLFL